MAHTNQRYLFGQGDLPARRLQKLAQVFEPTTKAFLKRAHSEDMDVAIDLGCGPGYTTQLVAETLRPRMTYGLDNAGVFLEIARAKMSENIDFAEHDIRETPFPTPAADVIFGRYILAHLGDIPKLVTSWGTQLEPGGVMLLEETEQMETNNPMFARYIEIVEAMLKHNGSQLYAGRIIKELNLDGLMFESNHLAEYDVSNRDAAAMFSMNIPTWKTEPFIQQHYDLQEIANLESDLSGLPETKSVKSEIQWRLRQCVLRRAR